MKDEERKGPTCPFHTNLELVREQGQRRIGFGQEGIVGGGLKCPIKDCRYNQQTGQKRGLFNK